VKFSKADTKLTALMQFYMRFYDTKQFMELQEENQKNVKIFYNVTCKVKFHF